jgi:hypothetical protein
MTLKAIRQGLLAVLVVGIVLGGFPASAGACGPRRSFSLLRTTAPAALRSAASVRSEQARSVLRPGMRGADVRALQRRLSTLGYWIGATNGSYDSSTRQAVMALQKAAGLTRDGVLGTRTRKALNSGVRPRARTRSGHVIEIDLRHQLLLIVDGGRVSRILNTSTGSGARYRTAGGGRARAVTPRGSFRVTRQINAWHRSSLGLLYRPKYFHGGIAVHGSLSIPGYPASHGCVRLSVGAMNMIWSRRLMSLGTRVRVY